VTRCSTSRYQNLTARPSLRTQHTLTFHTTYLFQRASWTALYEDFFQHKISFCFLDGSTKRLLLLHSDPFFASAHGCHPCSPLWSGRETGCLAIIHGVSHGPTTARWEGEVNRSEKVTKALSLSQYSLLLIAPRDAMTSLRLFLFA
jgi:hypothetical protein